MIRLTSQNTNLMHLPHAGMDHEFDDWADALTYLSRLRGVDKVAPHVNKVWLWSLGAGGESHTFLVDHMVYTISHAKEGE